MDDEIRISDLVRRDVKLLLDAVEKEADRLEQDHKINGTWHGSSRGPCFYTFNNVGTILDVGQHDGTGRIYKITASNLNGVRLSVNRWWDNREDYWEEMIARYDRPDYRERRVVISHEHYVIGDGKGPAYGYGGRQFDIKFFDGRELTTRDLWHQGPIPPVFRERLPDNATWG